MCESGVVHGCPYIAEHMDVRERRCTWMYLYRAAQGCARAMIREPGLSHSQMNPLLLPLLR